MTGHHGDVLSLVYTSSASQPFRETALEQLLEECRENNAETGVTGMLLYRSGRFIQVLEGVAETVRALTDRIRRDPRHHDMRVLLEERVPQRRFPDWTMGYRALRGSGEVAPEGYRDSFSDLDADSDEDTARRALAELTLWFRVRSAASVGA
ncbi:hypothetical protein AUC47_04300 [Microbacterium sp. SZ1]|uniref:BLUF domain-containing protein n=1 Tax=Microbacterium sp. SZ1 TaxID=1849736 RepID=UPI000BD694B6|nr:BLUF domain-containing protein [Microbacterium sp. SZ1]PCE13886.1 hypothetical protein AUC47_04300 [Microbacterium sp. SZ1]